MVLENQRVIETSGGISGGDLPRKWNSCMDGDDDGDDDADVR